jgi:hypothetical protein
LIFASVRVCLSADTAKSVFRVVKIRRALYRSQRLNGLIQLSPVNRPLLRRVASLTLQMPEGFG